MTTPKRKAFSDQSRWQISKGIWWFAVPPATQPTNAHAFYTHAEAVDYFAANVRPIGPGE